MSKYKTVAISIYTINIKWWSK